PHSESDHNCAGQDPPRTALRSFIRSELYHRLQAIVARCCGRISDYTIVQRYTRERISYWLCRPAALELRRPQDGRNAVCLRRAEGQDLVPYRDGRRRDAWETCDGPHS